MGLIKTFRLVRAGAARNSRSLRASLFLLVFGFLGVIFLLSTHAATPVVSFEAETGTLSGSASVVTDNAASSKQAIKFNTAGGGTTPTRTTNCLPDFANTKHNTVSSQCGFPDSTNTGVQNMASLTATINDNYSISQDNFVLQNTRVNGQVEVCAKNVTLKNDYIVDQVVANSAPTVHSYGTSGVCLNKDGSGLKIIDTTIIGNQYSNACVGSSYTVIRVDCSGAQDGFKSPTNATEPTVIQDSYIHDLTGDHSDGVQDDNGDPVVAPPRTFNHNTIIGKDSCFFFIGGSSIQSNMTITNNLLTLTSGLFCVRVNQGNNQVITGNHFGLGPVDWLDTVHPGKFQACDTGDGYTAGGNVWDATGTTTMTDPVNGIAKTINC